MINGKIVADEWDKLDPEVRDKFNKICEENEWYALVERAGKECEISFLSPYPEVEHSVRAPTFTDCILKFLEGRE